MGNHQSAPRFLQTRTHSALVQLVSSIIQNLLPIQSKLHTNHTHIPLTDRRQKEWVSFVSSLNGLVTGRIASKLQSARMLTINHWTPINDGYSFNICKDCFLFSGLSENNKCLIKNQDHY